MHVQAVLEVLRKDQLYAYLKKCTFCTDQIMFLRYVVSPQGIHVDQDKVKAIFEWPIPTSISEIRSFHVLPSFYHRFVKDFSTIVAPYTSITKKNQASYWANKQTKSF